MRYHLMSKATPTLAPPVTVSKLDTTDWSLELWHAAYAMARRMIRDRAGHGYGAAYVWYLEHARRRFGASGWPVAQLAGRLAFDRHCLAFAATGSLPDLARQGLVRLVARPRPGNLAGVVPYRCASFERL